MRRILPCLFILPLASAAALPAHAQRENAQRSDEAAVRGADDRFWQAFNACDARAMARFFAPDVEFYHDITGLTRSRAAVTESMMKGPCGTPGLHMRRELVPASVRFQRIPGYGALLTGEHLFYARRGPGREHAETRARFTVIWKREAEGWVMTRVISVDHAPVAYRPEQKQIALSGATLSRHVGRYQTASGNIDIAVEADRLVLRSGTLRLTLAASAPDRFFALDRDLEIRFGESTITVIENGAEVASGRRVDPR